MYNFRKLKYGGFSLFITVVIITAVVLLNVIVELLSERLDVRIDLTDNMLFSVEDSTVEYLRNLNSDIKLTITNNEEDFKSSNMSSDSLYYSQMNEIVRVFAQSSDTITVEYVDLLRNPAFAGRYDTTLTPYNIIVESAVTSRYKILTPNEYLDIKYFSADGSPISERDAQMHMAFNSPVYQDISAAAEQAILSAIMSVSDETPTRVAFSAGYGEDKPSHEAFRQILEDNAFLVEELDLNLTTQIDDKLNILILFAPEHDYSNDVLNELERWLEESQDKTLVFVPGLQNTRLVNTDRFLAEWGLAVAHELIWQTDLRYAANDQIQYLKAVGEFSKGFEEDRFLGLFVRAVEQLRTPGVIAETLLESFDGAIKIPLEPPDWVESEQDEQEYFSTLPRGVYSVAAQSARVGVRGENGRLLVFGSPLLFDESLLVAEQYSHAEYFINVFNTLSGKDVTVTLAPKAFRLPALDIPAADVRNLTLIFCLALPLAVLILGMFVWIRRKRK
ncbi:MAG: GldG family protein [Oscillospiraceae bacterium]|nr:GldG family protein [Oscillospiraceae bacterium]